MTEVARWFSRRTYDQQAFDPADLAERKAAEGLSVSVVLPARNEAETVGAVIESALALRDSLVDEVVVVDGGSTDGTPEIAARAGARVVDDSGVLAHFGPCLGKGDALWRSLTVTAGDIVAFVDTDIRNPHPGFVWALLGPLLADPRVAFVKAFYERPLQVADVLHPTGGGRVTELTARPLLNLFWPQLAGLVQPLSGEYAGRRQLLESVPFFTGYGVELGLLLDVAGAAGIDAIAQVDLDHRVHRNQAMPSLSRMAYAIFQVAIRRLADSGRASLADELADRYVQFERGPEGLALLEGSVPITERPPLASLSRS